MLRSLFDQPKRIDQGIILQTNTSIKGFCAYVRELHNLEEELDSKYYRIELWAIGLLDALNELEQSKYCSLQYGDKVSKPMTAKMNPQELEHYQLHVYFYKNAFIRVFSVLDKLGHFLNDLFDLKTEKVKAKFSYFTVLRNMYENKLYPSLEKKLFDLKVSYQDPIQKLRKRRNMETHFINVEMLDDLKAMTGAISENAMIENLDENIAVLEQGYEMVCLSLYTVFRYAVEEDVLRG